MTSSRRSGSPRRVEEARWINGCVTSVHPGACSNTDPWQHNAQFNIVTDEPTDATNAGKSGLRIYKSMSSASSLPPLIIDVLLDMTGVTRNMIITNGNEGSTRRTLANDSAISKIMLERWTLDFTPSSSAASTGSTLKLEKPSINEEEMIQIFYQRCISHFTAVVTLLADLPAQQATNNVRSPPNTTMQQESENSLSIGTRLTSPSSVMETRRKDSSTAITQDQTMLAIDRGLEHESVVVERVRMKGIESPYGYVCRCRSMATFCSTSPKE